MTKRTIKQFEKKQGIEFEHSVEPGVLKFSGQRFFSEDDIKYDLNNNVPPGRIILYQEEGRDGNVPDYKTWLIQHYGE